MTAPGTTSGPWFAEHDVTLWQGHVLDVLPTLPAESVNCVVTSPPYYGLRDYGADGQIGLEASPAEYVETLRAVFAEVRRVLRPDGTLWLNLGDSYSSGRGELNIGFNERYGKPPGARKQDEARPSRRRDKAVTAAPRDAVTGLPPKNLLMIPERVAMALQDDGWVLRNKIAWVKPNAMPDSVTDRLACRYELVYLFAKSQRYTFDLDAIRQPHSREWAAGRNGGRNGWDRGDHLNAGLAVAAPHPLGGNPGDVWSIPTAPYPEAHFATMPPELARRCIAAGCPPDGTVLDPFAGSGTTLMVARRLLRKSVGIELNEAYCGLIVDRVGQPVFDFGDAS